MRTTIISDSDPVNRAFAVTPSDSTDLAVKGCKIYLSASGDLKVTLHKKNPSLAGGDTVTFTTKTHNAHHPIASNSGPHRWKNRRVVVSMLSPADACVGSCLVG